MSIRKLSSRLFDQTSLDQFTSSIIKQRAQIIARGAATAVNESQLEDGDMDSDDDQSPGEIASRTTALKSREDSTSFNYSVHVDVGNLGDSRGPDLDVKD